MTTVKVTVMLTATGRVTVTVPVTVMVTGRVTVTVTVTVMVTGRVTVTDTTTVNVTVTATGRVTVSMIPQSYLNTYKNTYIRTIYMKTNSMTQNPLILKKSNTHTHTHTHTHGRESVHAHKCAHKDLQIYKLIKFLPRIANVHIQHVGFRLRVCAPALHTCPQSYE